MNKKIKTLLCLSALSLAQVAQSWDWGRTLYKEQELKLSASQLQAFTINVGAGDIDITGQSKSDEILVEAKVYGKKIDDDDFVLSLDTSGKKAKLKAFFTKDNVKNAYIDLKIVMPNSLALDLDDRSGDIRIEGLNANVQINDRSGDIEVSQIQGDLSIDDRSGDVNANRVDGRVDIEDRSGDIELKELGGDLMIRDSSGDVYVKNVDGKVTVSDSSGDISINGAADFKLKSDSSGDVVLRNINSRN